MRWLIRILGLGLVVAAALWVLSAPPRLDEEIAIPQGDADRGKLVFAAAGCASCHKAKDSDGTAGIVLAGGEAFPSDFGTFYAPNISTDPQAGIGAWTDREIVQAVTLGVSPSGQYYYPVFPSHAYALATLDDIADLVAFMRTLPADATPSQAHDIGFPFTIRRSMWAWRMLFAPTDWVVATQDPEIERGRYLVEALGHCAECHTPRNALGGLARGQWMAGAPLPSGPGRVPGLNPAQFTWSATDIAEYLRSGFTPEYDVAGGKMADVIANTSQLSDEDRAAIAAYIKAID